MKVILYMATTINGFIGLPDGNSDWVIEEDWKELSKFIKDSGIVVMGRKTYEVCEEEFPFDNALNVVLTRNKKLHKKVKTAWFTDKKPSQIVKWAKENGFKKLLVIGGRETNTAFLKEKLIDEIVLSIHPLIFMDGMKIFHESSDRYNLQLLSVKKFSKGLVQLHYKVKK